MIKKIFPILALPIFSSMLGVGIVAPLLPLYAENMGATGSWLGIVFAGFAISLAIFLPIIGRLSDRIHTQNSEEYNSLVILESQ